MPRTTGLAVGNLARRAQAIARARALAPIIGGLLADGVASNARLAIALNAQAVPAMRGGVWSGAQVRRVRLWLEEP
jgi:hypothetical protein